VVDDEQLTLGTTCQHRWRASPWLLQRSPNILLIPGTSSVAHLRQNVASAALTLSQADVAELNSIGG
jgi:pyridoxine 4-dehydrogenase